MTRMNLPDTNEVTALVAAIRRDPEDDTARLVLADWLQEHVEGSEDLQALYRGKAEEWLQRYVEGNASYYEDQSWFDYDYVVQTAQRCLDENYPGFNVGDAQSAELHGTAVGEFWDCIAVMLGRHIPDDFRKHAYFTCSC